MSVRKYSLAALVVLVFSPTVHADTFGTGENTFVIEFVPVPNVGDHEIIPVDENGIPLCRQCTITVPGNRPDEPSGVPVGSVPYDYRIGKFEISASMIDADNALGGLGITHDNRGPGKPATSVSWFDAARFVNWLNEDQGFTPAYKFDGNDSFQLWEPDDPGYNAANLFRNSQACYVLPSLDEWYKAAYYDVAAEDYNH